MGKPLIAGNWKMHGTAESARNLATQLSQHSFQEMPMRDDCFSAACTYIGGQRCSC